MIVVTVDTSPASEAALTVAADLAVRFKRPVRVLLVLDGALRHHFDELSRLKDVALTVAVQDYLEDAAGTIRKYGIDQVETAFRHGVDAGTEIVAAVSEQDGALLVMSTHGRSGLSRWLTGSVTEHVIRSSPVPVVIVPAHTRARAS